MNLNEPFVSVVTPVYNTNEYLSECIESVLNQTYRNWEYIIVNNCSTDGSLDIALSYAKKDSRIRVVNNKTFLSQPANYNHALRQISARSRYCKIVQADDWIFAQCLSEMVKVAESDQDIAIVGAYQLAGPDVKCQGLSCNAFHQPYTNISGFDACRMFFLNRRYFFGTPTSILYRASIIRNRDPFFNESIYHEDSEVCFELLERYRFGFVHKILTYTRMDNLSISTSVQNFEPDALHAYIITKKSGRLYLSEEEYNIHLKKIEDNLYSLLAYNIFRRRGRRFWEYYSNGFIMAGGHLNWWRLSCMQVLRIFRWIGNPFSTGEQLCGLLRSALFASTSDAKRYRKGEI